MTRSAKNAAGKNAGISRRDFNRLLLAAGAGVASISKANALPATSAAPGFLHPGILHTRSSLERMRTGIRERDAVIYAGFEKLRQHPCSQADYTPHSFGDGISRNPSRDGKSLAPSVNMPAFDLDANAAYQCALMAELTGDSRYAATARRIVVGWSKSLQRVFGGDAVLAAGLGPFKFVNAAELLCGIGELDKNQSADCAAMLQRAVVPTIINFAPFANGNWDTAAIKTMMACAVFCDDPALFERALLYVLHGDGDGRMQHYIYKSGQCQESGRDQTHTQLGLGHLGDTCEIAWNQGLDLYGAGGNLLLRGFEYTAAHNLGEHVEFVPDVDRTGKYRHTAISPPSQFRPVYEQIYAHYHVRRALPAPYIERVLAKIRPEGEWRGADHPGFGSLLFANRSADDIPLERSAAPAALWVESREGSMEISWLPSRKNTRYWLERTDSQGAKRRFRVLAGASSFRDSSVKNGTRYTYRLRTDDPSLDSLPTSAFHGLPAGWDVLALGEHPGEGGVRWDGRQLSVRTGGCSPMAKPEEGHFVALPPQCAHLKAKFLPLTASQWVSFGLACRTGSNVNSPAVELFVNNTGGELEVRRWSLTFAQRQDADNLRIISTIDLNSEQAPYGRLVNPIWFQMQKSSGSILARYSFDAERWIEAGAAPFGESGRLGVLASSGIADVVAEVNLDMLAMEQSPA